jgi:hypothetical protein
MVPLLGQGAPSGGLQLVPRTHTDSVQQHLRHSYPHLYSDPDDWCELAPGDPFLGKGILPIAGRGDLILWDSRLIHGGRVGTGPDALGWATRIGTNLDPVGPNSRWPNLAAVGSSLGIVAGVIVRGIRRSCWLVPTVTPSGTPTAQKQNRAWGTDPPQLARLSCTVCMTERRRATPAALQQRRDAVATGAALTHWAHQPAPHTLGDTGGGWIGIQEFTPPRLSATQLALVG